MVPTSIETAPLHWHSSPILFVERDTAWLLVRRRMVGTMTRLEWDKPVHRVAALQATWTAAQAAMRVNDEEFVTHAPVVLYRHPLTGAVACADIDRGAGRELITPTGKPLERLPHPPQGMTWTRERTTYATWAEGPLPHRVYDMPEAPTPFGDRAVQQLRHQNGALRDLIDGALGPAEFADMTRDTPTLDDLVDFRIRGVFRRRDYRVLVSKQDSEQGSKILTPDGMVE